jgi:hypothetical protein
MISGKLWRREEWNNGIAKLLNGHMVIWLYGYRFL